ncbi:hypothetical protein ABZ713_06555, partial [Streptomyces sp. NPDC006875]
MPLSLRPLFAGIDIGGTTTQVVVCSDDLKVLDRAETATPAREERDAGRAVAPGVARRGTQG